MGVLDRSQYVSEANDADGTPCDLQVPDPDDPFEAAGRLVKSGAVDGIYRRLQAQFAYVDPADIEDAVYNAFEKLATRPTQPDNPRAWVLAVARNKLIDQRRRKPTHPLDPEDDGLLGVAASAEQEALVNETYRTVCDHIQRTWPSAKSKTVVLLVLEAAHLGEPINNADLAAQASQILSEHISTGAAATLKSRGLDRLSTEYPSLFGDITPEFEI